MDENIRKKLKSKCEQDYNQYNDAIGLAFNTLATKATELGADFRCILNEYLESITEAADTLTEIYAVKANVKDAYFLEALRMDLKDNALTLAHTMLNLTNDYLENN